MNTINTTNVGQPTTVIPGQTGETKQPPKTTSGGMTGITFTPDMLKEIIGGTSGKSNGKSMTGPETFKLPPGVTPEALTAKLKEFIAGASDRTALFAALIELMNSQRQNAVEQRANAREMAKTQMLEGAQLSRDAADKQEDAAISSLVGGIISGAMQILGGSLSLGMQVKFSNMKFGSDAVMNKASTIHTAQQQAINAFTGAGSSIAGSGGQQAGAMQQADASNLQADSQEMQAGSQDSLNQQDIEKKFSEDLTQVIQSVIQFMKEIRNAEIERMSSITRG
ncbi:hypothetical protein [Aquibium sp. ELW1220]|uniref:hypothetical protein n=1 Tax=Aquibium sp. ELW1220 TaxID=2976766 RepID=UPI0025B0D887|nr:hypothetical protein [Aquibium sp. ELW1220]MDN2581414.1 hypothetical protein [Aquibium sp. ELW1220]